MHEEPPFPGALEALDELAARDDVLLGIATGKSRRGVDAIMNLHDLHGRFVTIQTADNHPSKPHPSMVATAIAEAGVLPQRTVMIGDTTYDMEMAKAAGARAIGVSWGYHPSESLLATGADALLSTFDELGAALDLCFGGARNGMTETGPMQAAQRLMRPELPKRFYKEVEVSENDGVFGILLDGRPVRTPARNLLAVPSRALAEVLAAEWAAQADLIDPFTMPVTRIVNSALDGVARDAGAVRAEIVKYAGSDLVCYRADGPIWLVERQTEAWDPILAWARDELGARFMLTEGVVFVTQPETALKAVAEAVEPVDVLRLAAVSTAMTLTGSALIALALLKGRLSLQEAWAAAHIDEDWNNELWGADDEAMERRALRFREMEAAARVIALAAA